MAELNSAHIKAIRNEVNRALSDVKITDIHTHIYSPRFGSLLLWGIDDLLTYHYLIAETMRWINIPYQWFWKMSKRDQANVVWKTLFLDHSPISEACRGVLTVLQSLGLDVSSRDLDSYRRYFSELSPEEYVDRVFKAANLRTVLMTNDPFDDTERSVWLSDVTADSRFHAALRLDVLLNSWQAAVPKLNEWGYSVASDFSGQTISEVRRFLTEWIGKMNAVYMAASLPPNFAFPDDSACGTLIADCVLPVAEETGKPLALMIGVKRRVNPGLEAAGDTSGRANIEVLERLCSGYPNVKFLATMLARENMHELCVTARKFRNLMIFGCWWFLNNPSLIDEITRMRLELLGLSMIPQHSDARVLDQLIYKWSHSRKIIGEALGDKYIDIAATGWKVTPEEIRRDVEALLGGNFWSFVAS